MTFIQFVYENYVFNRVFTLNDKMVMLHYRKSLPIYFSDLWTCKMNLSTCYFSKITAFVIEYRTFFILMRVLKYLYLEH